MVVITGAVSRAKLQSNHRDSDTVFCARRDSIERNSYGNVAGCPSHSGIVSKRLNLSENLFDRLKAPSL